MTAVLGLDIGGSTTRAVRAEDGECVAEARAGSATSARSAPTRRAANSTRCWPGCGPTASPPSAPGPRAPTPHPPGPHWVTARAATAGGRGRGRARRPADPRRRRSRRGHRGHRGRRVRGLGPQPGRPRGPRGASATCSATRAAATGRRARPCDTCCTAPTPAPRRTRSAPLCSTRAGSPCPSTCRPLLRPSRARVLGRARRGGRADGRERSVAAECRSRRRRAGPPRDDGRRRLDTAGPVVLGGGFAVHEPALRAAVAARLAAVGIADVRVILRDPVAGAVRLAQRLLETS